MPRLLPLLFATTIFLSAFLLFQVQPISARFAVPWFGGSAAVWTACLLFFQIALLGGYLYAHASIRFLKPRAQAVLHVALLLISIFAFSIVPSPAMKPSGTEEPVGRILLLLASTVGLKYFLLSTTGPLLQAWYAARRPSDRYPYRLYALSNFGSMIALLGYPTLVEPLLPLRSQAALWTGGYLLFTVLCAGVALTTPNREGAAADERPELPLSSAPTPGQYAYWVFLSAVASALLLGITDHISQNIAAVPLLWILPLSLYLLTFIVCFGGKDWQGGRRFLGFPMLGIAAMAYCLLDGNAHPGVWLLLGIFLGGLFFCCLLCHGELARQKPAPRYLTAFYLMLSLGGALGGSFVALVSPALFNAHYELPIALGACALVAVAALYSDRQGRGFQASLLSLSALTALILYTLTVGARGQAAGARVSLRSFYGVLQVRDYGGKAADTTAYRALTNGTILHGTQRLDPTERRTPTTYYARDSGIGRAISATRSPKVGQRVGIIGLGTGTCAAYGQPGDQHWYFDINPQVIEIARSEFSYLKDSPAQTATVLGDARLSLEKMPPLGLDVLAVDAFTSDSIPIHLLTEEAFATYFRHLRPGGVLCVHVSNRYVRLQPVVAATLRKWGTSRKAVVISSDDEDRTGATASEWVLITNSDRLLKRRDMRSAAQPLETEPGLRPWTDDYSNLFQVLK
ncbi:MAG: fused MFS/spermidine synthase [Cytophagales bacterium]|nr:fused MFS/spermidine synthase [Armatimonadota bacterium]